MNKPADELMEHATGASIIHDGDTLPDLGIEKQGGSITVSISGYYMDARTPVSTDSLRALAHWILDNTMPE